MTLEIPLIFIYVFMGFSKIIAYFIRFHSGFARFWKIHGTMDLMKFVVLEIHGTMDLI